MTPLDSLDGWLPIDFVFKRTGVTVNWMEFQPRALADPFFNWTIERLRSSTPAAREQSSDLQTFLAKLAFLRPVQPSGIIFHVSRCGSTLISNACGLAPNTLVLSEARPVGILCQPNVLSRSPFRGSERDQARRMLLDFLLASYAHSEAGSPSRLVIKGNGTSILHIPLFRSVWPHVPFIVVIRDPVEVIMSVLRKGAGWLRFKEETKAAKRLFGWPEAAVVAMSMEEYCARVLGRFYEAPRDLIDNNCRLVDYQNLDARMIQRIGTFFGLDLPAEDSPQFTKVMETYAKDPEKKQQFERDNNRKQRDAPAAVRASAERWARGHYESLSELQNWPASS